MVGRSSLAACPLTADVFLWTCSRPAPVTCRSLGARFLPLQPEVVGSLTGLTELLCDFNKISRLPALLGNLTRLQHLDASNNKITHLADDIGCCTQLSYLQLSANNLRVLALTVHLPECV